MLALVCGASSLEVVERPTPTPGPREVLVRADASGMNNADLAQAAGRYPAPPGVAPDIPGLELCGEVMSVGAAVETLTPGDVVVALVGGGAHAEFAVAHEDLCIRLPASIDRMAAAGFVEAYATGFDALFNQCSTALGDRVLVRGAAGGVGIATVQLALRAGARVVAGVRTDLHRDALEKLGAEVTTTPVEKSDETFDVIVDLVGVADLDASLRRLRTGGRLSLVATGNDGPTVNVNAARIMSRRLQVSGATLRARPHPAKAALIGQITAAVVPHFIAGNLSVPIYRRYPLADALSAFAAFSEPGKLGKIVLTASTIS